MKSIHLLSTMDIPVYRCWVWPPGQWFFQSKSNPAGHWHSGRAPDVCKHIYPGLPTTIKTMGVNITTIDYLRVLIIEIGSTIILMVVDFLGIYIYHKPCKSSRPLKLVATFGILDSMPTKIMFVFLERPSIQWRLDFLESSCPLFWSEKGLVLEGWTFEK